MGRRGFLLGALSEGSTGVHAHASASLSRDGRWWWDGARWVATASEEGLWRWDGFRWRPTLDLSRTRPRDLPTTLALLAEDRYARAGAILVERAAEWRPAGPLLELVGRAATLRQRLWGIERSTADWSDRAGLRGLLRALSTSPDDRLRAEQAAAGLDAERRALLVEVGRAAPRPTVKEADELLEPARLLEARAGRLIEALSAIDEAERDRAIATASAQRDLEAAEARRRAAIAAAERAVVMAEEAHTEAVREARERLWASLAPEPGPALAAVGPLQAFAGSVATPEGRLPLAGMAIAAGTASTLWRQHRDLLTDLIGLETLAAAALADCLVEGRGDLFLLLLARSRVQLWRCPPGQERVAHRFVRALGRLAAGAATVAGEPGAVAGEAELVAIGQARAAALDEARAALARLEADPGLLDAVEWGRRRLSAAVAPGRELEAVQRRLGEEVSFLLTPPPPFRATPAAGPGPPSWQRRAGPGTVAPG